MVIRKLPRLILAAGLGTMFGFATLMYADEPPPIGKTEAASAAPQLLTWHKSLAAGIAEARRRKVGILVKIGAEWCGWCHKLDGEIERPELQKELSQWVLVRLDADHDADDVQKLSVGPIPALRLVDLSGRPTRTHDGFLPAAEMIDWLHNRSATDDESPQLAVLNGDFDPKSLPQVVQLLGHRDANIREAATRRLLPQKNVAGVHVSRAFTRGTLAVRLATIELLTNWKAPVHGLDPWRPETITVAQLSELEAWADQLDNTPQEDKPVEVPLAPEQIEAARQEMLRINQLDITELEALGARLARHGAALVPLVSELRGQAETDLARERLDWLRYRLVASDTLALKWPGGLNMLAATDAQLRRTAAAELSSQITNGDERLLLELFQNADPVVRELALKALHEVGGTRAQEELIRLLNDPEPNVRAAVLKQMATQPSAKLLPAIADYVTRETDTDLMVHAVRLLRQIKTATAVECLITLLPHASWQVRAETVDAIGEIVGEGSRVRNQTGGVTEEVQADAYVAILEVLADKDGFVVSRAMNALKESDLAIAAPKLAAVVETHPELGGAVAESLINGSKIRSKGIPLLQTWLTKKEDHLRAAAIHALGRAGRLDIEKQLIPALSDVSEKVRIASAEEVWSYCERLRPTGETVSTRPSIEPVASQRVPGPFEWIISQFIPGATAPRVGLDIVVTDTDESDDAWLDEFRLRERSKKLGELARPPLGVMLKSSFAAERLAAGTALIPLGDDALALPVLAKLAQEERQVLAVARSLHWLPWSLRAELFGQLRPLAADSHELATLCQELVVRRDTRASALLWELLAAENVTGEFAASLLDSLFHNHRISQDRTSYAYVPDPPPPAPVGVDTELWTRLGTSGASWQQRVAWLLLVATDQETCRAVTQAAADNPKLANELRVDAFQLLLLVTPQKEARQLAAAALLDLGSPVRRAALSFLIDGKSGITDIAGGVLSIPPRNVAGQTSDDSQLAIPPELTADHLRSFLSDSDEQIVAQSAYLLALLGNADGLERLVAYYRKIGGHPNNDEFQQQQEQWEHRVYEAIAASDDSQHVPILEQIYEVMARDRRDRVRNFYWTIRSMHGPEILKLRKRIRAEIGMDNLR